MQDLLSRLGTLDANIDPLPLEQIARDTGFARRSPRKAGARQWLRAICLLSVLPTRSFRAFFDLLSERCLGFSIGPFTRNDQKASGDILRVARPGDLVLRDLGYSSLRIFAGMREAGIDFISRLKYGTHLFDKTGAPFDLLRSEERRVGKECV